MHFSWQKHLELSRTVSNTADENTGVALSLMGIALTLLAKDLLSYELQISPTAQEDQDLSKLPG